MNHVVGFFVFSWHLALYGAGLSFRMFWICSGESGSRIACVASSGRIVRFGYGLFAQKEEQGYILDSACDRLSSLCQPACLYQNIPAAASDCRSHERR